ncbi:3-methyl-2-oxobutanoate hydroxymethyltransferase [Gilvimarinus sp. F26214L]|uniref:3-methyl-2-oxobutanoate hydroxymethyltransferase n=1 Tax=Gilvimarinus sp. DZF01 TaxID=3461371 RepID=UPI004045545E
MEINKPFSVPEIVQSKGRSKLVMLTAYDYPTAQLLDAHSDLLLVGDTLGCVVQGRENTLGVTLEHMIYHGEMVARGARHALVVGDLPFGSYQPGPQAAQEAAIRLIKEAGVSAVKLEGGERSCPAIEAIVAAGIPVVGHIGLTPQSFHVFGGNRVQGRTEKDAERLVREARAVEAAGAFALILEAIPATLARRITDSTGIPTIGIGAGPHCDGQVLVTPDMIGLNISPAPMKYNKEYCTVRELIGEAAKQFAADVRDGQFPDIAHSYTVSATG